MKEERLPVYEIDWEAFKVWLKERGERDAGTTCEPYMCPLAIYLKSVNQPKRRFRVTANYIIVAPLSDSLNATRRHLRGEWFAMPQRAIELLKLVDACGTHKPITAPTVLRLLSQLEAEEI